MPPLGFEFEPAIPEIKPPETYALDPTAIGIGTSILNYWKLLTKAKPK
jgi:hypothetical protein